MGQGSHGDTIARKPVQANIRSRKKPAKLIVRKPEARCEKYLGQCHAGNGRKSLRLRAGEKEVEWVVLTTTPNPVKRAFPVRSLRGKNIKSRSKIMRMFVFFTLLLIGLPSYAKEISGVMVNDTLQTEDSATLHLNGAGVRSKFFVDVYIAELYMEKPSASAAEVIGDKGKKRIVMHFLHSEVSKDKLVGAWNDGFKENNSAGDLAKLQDRINQFNGFFVDVKKDDVIVLDYAPATGTVVTIKGQKKGTIPGADFSEALLKIWLGDHPVDSGLKDKLLSIKK